MQPRNAHLFELTDSQGVSTGHKKSGRKPGSITKCPHKNQKHFAMGMCNHCYHKFGRRTQVTNCEHVDLKNYAKGKCQNCYINEYNRIKRIKNKESSPK